MYYFTERQIELSQAIEYEPFQELFNGEKSLYQALCVSSVKFRGLNDIEKLKEATFVGVMLRLSLRDIDLNCKPRHNRRPTKPIAHAYLLHLFKRHNKAIITDALGCDVDIVEVGQFLNLYRGRSMLMAIKIYLVEAGIINDIDDLRMVVKSNKIFPKRYKKK